MSLDQRRPFASAHAGPNSVEEVGEEDEVEQLMQNYENLLGGGDPNLARLRQRIHRVTEQTDNSESNSTSRFEAVSKGQNPARASAATSQAGLVPASDGAGERLDTHVSSFQDSVNGDKPVRSHRGRAKSPPAEFDDETD